MPQGAEGVTLKFDIWTDLETSTSYDKVALKVKLQVGALLTMAKSTLVSSKTWKTVSAQIPAAGGKTIKLEFSFDTVDGAYNTYEGVYIDNIEVLQSCLD